jgi:uncharacterized protein (DUF433 family)
MRELGKLDSVWYTDGVYLLSMGEMFMAILTSTAPKLLGRYIVSDPAIAHGQPTFRGTRIFVADVLDQVARGLTWEAIIEDWNGKISKAAIAEAVQLATQAFINHADEFVVEPAAA